jgi:glycosyltransferase involved in cell wall biosynthesis
MAMRFSIVVPTLNRKEMLISAIESIRAQGWSEIEIIVVDGGSADGTVEHLKIVPDICLLSGPDRGIYDAFNKGISRATGEVVGILNSDDAYEPGSFAAVAHAFAENPNAQAVCGSATRLEDGRVVRVYDQEADKLITSPRTLLIGQCMVNARFFRRAQMARVGRFSLDYRYVADRDWLIRWYEAGLMTAAIRQRVYRYRQHRGSLTFNPRGPHTSAIRADLLALAQKWRLNASASRETRRIAGLLEGRCRAMLALEALQRGRITIAGQLLLSDDGRLSFAPLGRVVCSSIDRLVMRA